MTHHDTPVIRNDLEHHCFLWCDSSILSTWEFTIFLYSLRLYYLVIKIWYFKKWSNIFTLGLRDHLRLKNFKNSLTLWKCFVFADLLNNNTACITCTSWGELLISCQLCLIFFFVHLEIMLHSLYHQCVKIKAVKSSHSSSRILVIWEKKRWFDTLFVIWVTGIGSSSLVTPYRTKRV